MNIKVFFQDLELLQTMPEQAFTEIMDKSEQQRYLSMKNTKQKFVYAASRFCLKKTLSSLCGIPTDSLRFYYGKHGKPYIENNKALHFNISHSRKMLMMAVSSRPVGVDVEQIANRSSMQKTVNRYFADSEKSLYNLAADDQKHVFYSIWTAKEALLKASGKGISVNLAEISAELGYEWRNVECGQNFFVKNIPCPAGFCAAIAVEGQRAEIVEEQIEFA